MKPSFQRAVAAAARAAGISRRVTCHGFRHSFATHLLERAYDIEAGDIAMAEFRQKHPLLKTSAAQALAWCYMFDWK